MLDRPYAGVLALSLTVSLCAQQPPAWFDAPNVVLAEDSPPFQKLFDYDGDGAMDAVGTRVNSNGTRYELVVWRNENGRFVPRFQDAQEPVTQLGFGRNMAVATGDLDGDGRTEFAAATGYVVNVYRNTGAGFVRTESRVTQKVNDLAIADFDGDGRDDLAILCREPVGVVNGFVTIRLAAGGNLTASLPVELAGTSRLEVLDVDGDGRADLGAWQVRALAFHPLRVGPSSIAVETPLRITVASASGLAYWSVGDIDGDGDVDVVAFELPTATQPARVHAFRRTGATSFVGELAYLGGPAEFLLDADGDGDLDGVCCGGGGSGGTPTWPKLDFGSRFEFAINDGTGRLAEAFSLPGKGSSRLAGVADIDGDGALDFVGGACVHYQRAPLSADTAPTTGIEGLELFDVASYRDQLADSDRDGDPDFLLSLARRGTNDGHGGMTLRSSSPSPVPPGFVVSVPQFRGDFNGDGAPDILAPLFHSGATPTFSHMELFANQGSGVLVASGPAAPPQMQIGWLYRGFVTALDNGYAADVDGDGDLDVLALANPIRELQMRSEVWWNQGGQFVAGPVLPTERIDAVADFDGDGIPDFVTRATNLTGVVVRLGTGNASAPFGPPMTVLPAMSIALRADAVRVVDPNDDGRPDLLVMEDRPTTPSISGTLLCTNTTATPGQPSFVGDRSLLGEVSAGVGSVAIGDFDGDSRSDILVNSPVDAAWATRIYRRVGGDGLPLAASHFDAPIDQATYGGHAADVDADGDLDLVGGWVIRNLHRHGVTAGLRRQRGLGTAGEAGHVPLLGIGGVVRAGETIELRAAGITGPTVGLLVFASQGADRLGGMFPGVRSHVDEGSILTSFGWVLSAAGGGRASGFASLPLVLPPALIGVTLHTQLFVLDLAAPTGIASSNGLELRVGG